MKNSGFTVTELLVSIAIFAILLFIGIPSYQGLSESGNLVSSTNGMIGAFNYARIEAVKRGNTVQLGQLDGSSWTGGIVAWVDLDADGVRDSGEELRLWKGLASGSTVDSVHNRSAFAFRASGEVDNDDELTICDNRTGEEGRKISILTSGAVIAEKVTCG
ncbi:GspH/FimT family pseudopilin [Psychromonas aquimarina]|uniref:GspH/FimT family pseudopilin n=1 Tax=Psychromonas aquimarina TaxID=444919 RepID=UPI000411F087|nr:GspH/FimT family pseudopilin [Psychromonas aquimarina]